MVTNWRRIVLIAIDGLMVALAYYLAFIIRYDFRFPAGVRVLYGRTVFVMVGMYLAALFLTMQYRKIWRYATYRDIISLCYSLTAGGFAAFVTLYYFNTGVPRTVSLITLCLLYILISASRIIYRQIWNRSPKVTTREGFRVLVVGAGRAGEMLITEMLTHRQLGRVPVAILDDDPNKLYRNIQGVPVVGVLDNLRDVIQSKDIHEVIFAIPTAPRILLKQVIDACRDLKVRVRTLPGIYELIEGKVMVSQLRNIEINDLLGRDPVQVDMGLICGYINEKRVLVTGGGGSIGSELCRQIAWLKPKELAILDIHENSLYDIQQELLRRYPDLIIHGIIADMKDAHMMASVFSNFKPEIVYHAAAHKHVPLMEDNIQEAVKNNVFGTLNVVEQAATYGVQRFVLISTDKAVNPTSIMGATKRICERIIQAFDHDGSKTEYVAVRFGNVLGSNGSVIPLFRKQIEEGGPVTVTHADIERYFMTIPEAVQLVIQAGAQAKGGEIFVLDMGEPVKIMDLAKDLIKLSGYEPDVDIQILVTGLRPGEKLYEELTFHTEQYETTLHDRILIEKAKPVLANGVIPILKRYKDQIHTMDKESVKELIRLLVPEYTGDASP